MSISHDKVQAALDKIEANRNKNFVESVLKNCKEIETIPDPIAQLQKLKELRGVFSALAGRNKDNSEELYDAIVENISHAISEHAAILVQHAKEVLAKDNEKVEK